jgi:hypothetical protein
MNNVDLDRLLKGANVPQPRPGFWDELPRNVQAVIDRGAKPMLREETVAPGILELLFRRAAVPVALVAICVAIGFLRPANSHWPAIHADELREARACWREAAELFPNQLELIVFDQKGSRVIVAERPNQPSSPPLYVKFCDVKGCKRFITFSGQQIEVNGEHFEVLADRQGEVLLVGDAKVFKGSKKASAFGAYSVVALSLTDS